MNDWRGSKLGDDFAVLGNILVGEEVVNQAYDAFEHARDKAFSNRMMQALKAGEKAGGKAAVTLLQRKFDKLYQE
ncbi:MAG: DUF1028 domain-containing protein [Idiomarina sp.]